MGDLTGEPFVETRDRFRPHWEFYENNVQKIRDMYYYHVRRRYAGTHEPRWKGHILWKFPSDIVLYAQAIFDNKPDYIIETGTAWGGSATFFGDMLSLIGSKGKVFSIDVDARATPEHSSVEYVKGSSVDPEIVNRIRETVKGAKVMASLDSSHSERHVRRELRAYSGIVTIGQYMVVEDCYTMGEVPYQPGRAVQWFRDRVGDRYTLEPKEDQFIMAVTRGGWLRRIK